MGVPVLESDAGLLDGAQHDDCLKDVALLMWKKQALALWEQLVRLLRRRDDDWSLLGHRVHFRGEITSGGELEIRGRVEGDIDHTGRLIIGPGGRCISNIHTDELQIAGEVHGNVHVVDLLEVLPTGRLYGDSVCGLLRVHPGGIMLGGTRMTSAVPPEPVLLPPRPEPVLALSGPLAVLSEPVSGSERAELFRPRRAEAVMAEPDMRAQAVMAEPDTRAQAVMAEPDMRSQEPMAPAPASANDHSPAFYGGFYPTAPPGSDG